MGYCCDAVLYGMLPTPCLPPIALMCCGIWDVVAFGRNAQSCSWASIMLFKIDQN